MGDEVGDRQPAPGPQHAPHVGELDARLVEVMDREAGHHDVEAVVEERQRGGVALHEQHVGRRVLAALLEHRFGGVERDDRADAWRKPTGDMAGPRCDVEHEVGPFER